MALWYDLSPVRPWEWPGIDAEAWTEAVQLRNAWHAGIDDAADEAAMERRLSELEVTA